MKIILSPAKKMKTDTDSLPCDGLPSLIVKTEKIMRWLQSQTPEYLTGLWGCSQRIANLNIDRLAHMDLYRNLTPAILSYDGIAFQYMGPSVFTYGEFDYVQENLRILSAFYGAVKPMDGVTPYRLEMQAKAHVDGAENMYEFWGGDIYNAVTDESRIIINLASEEYSKCVEKYLTDKDTYITITFCEKYHGKLVTKGTYAKMARGEMVRFMAENRIEEPEKIKEFSRLGYVYRDSLSTPTDYVFERINTDKGENLC